MNPAPNLFIRILSTLACLARLLGPWPSLPAHAAETRPPVLNLELASNTEGSWLAGTPLAIKVSLQHPLAAGDPDTTPWLLNPAIGWASALSLVVSAADGQILPWTFERSAGHSTGPLSLQDSSTALVGFILNPASGGDSIPPGRYQIRARLAATDGTGWRGQIETGPLFIQRLGAVPPVIQLQPPVPGSLYRGWPWSARIWIELPASAKRFAIPGGMGGWLVAISLDVKNGDGSTVSWPFVIPRQWPDLRTFLEPGGATDKLSFRLPSSVTSGLPPGTYRLTARFTGPAGRPGASLWSGLAESTPLEITVADPPADPDPELLKQKDLLEIYDSLADAENLRIAARDRTLGTTRQLETIRQAAAPLLRAEQAAKRLMARHPDDPAPALFLAAIMRDQDDKERALVYARLAEGLAGDLPRPTPEPGFEDSWVDFPELFQRQSLEILPEVPDPLLTPELRTLIAATRGDGPEPATFAEQERYFALDPNAQWAATAIASSEYRAADYSASRATGAPDVSRYGDSPLSWASRQADSGDEWLELAFSQPVPAVAVRVRQNFNPGAISKVELFDISGAVTTVFNGRDTNTYAASQLSWFVARFPRTSTPIQRIRLTLDSARVKGWNEIDAVQLVTGSAPPNLAYSLQTASGTMVFTTWPSGFVLQRASRLVPGDWALVTNPPPVTIELGQKAEFFRLTKAP